MYPIWHHFKKKTKRLFNVAFGWTVEILNRFYWLEMDKTFASMFYHISDSNGIHVTVTKVLGRIFLFIVGEESRNDPDGFVLFMFQDVINFEYCASNDPKFDNDRSSSMLPMYTFWWKISLSKRMVCEVFYFAICFAN